MSFAKIIREPVKVVSRAVILPVGPVWSSSSFDLCVASLRLESATRHQRGLRMVEQATMRIGLWFFAPSLLYQLKFRSLSTFPKRGFQAGEYMS
jgi:hypothetical protein